MCSVCSVEAGRTPIEPNVTVFTPPKNECPYKKDNKKKKTLVCLASGFYPDHVSVSWEINGKGVTDGVATDSAALRPQGDEFYQISSRLRVPEEKWNDPDNQFKCFVSFFDGTETKNYTDEVNGVKGRIPQKMSPSSSCWEYTQINICALSRQLLQALRCPLQEVKMFQHRGLDVFILILEELK